MILTQILKKTCVIVPLASGDKEAAIEELVDILDSNKLLVDRDMVLDAVLQREMTRSTGIGSGIAIPHGKCKGVNELVMALGVTKDEIDFDSIDGRGVRIVVLLASPTDKTGPHIQALARISRIMLDEELREKLASSKTADEAYNLISEKENE